MGLKYQRSMAFLDDVTGEKDHVMSLGEQESDSLVKSCVSLSRGTQGFFNKISRRPVTADHATKQMTVGGTFTHTANRIVLGNAYAPAVRRKGQAKTFLLLWTAYYCVCRHAVAQSVDATSWKIAGSIPDDVI